MTDTPYGPAPADAVERWLTVRRESLADGLDAMLDLDAGLHEVLIYARHNDTVHGAARLLDIDMGLAAILRPPMAMTPWERGSTPRARRGSAPRARGVSITALDPGVRLALRRDPLVVASAKSVLVSQAIDLVHGLAQAYQASLTLVRARIAHRTYNTFSAEYLRSFNDELTEILISTLDKAGDLTRALGRTWSLDLTRANLPRRADDLERRLIDIDARARALTSEPSDIARAVELARDHITPVCATALDLARALASDLDRSLIRAADNTHDSTGLGHARYLVVHTYLTENLVRVRKLVAPLGLTADLVADIERAYTRARELESDLERIGGDASKLRVGVARAAAMLLGVRESVELGVGLLNGSLDDFVDADLGQMDLADIDLSGVRWSLRGTRWPAALDVGRLQRASQETAPGSQIYVVQHWPGTTMSDHTVI